MTCRCCWPLHLQSCQHCRLQSLPSQAVMRQGAVTLHCLGVAQAAAVLTSAIKQLADVQRVRRQDGSRLHCTWRMRACAASPDECSTSRCLSAPAATQQRVLACLTESGDAVQGTL